MLPDDRMVLDSFMASEVVIVGLPALAGLAIVTVQKSAEAACRRAAALSLLALAGYLAMRVLFPNTGTYLSQTQAFVLDQLVVVSFGFAVYARRRSHALWPTVAFGMASGFLVGILVGYARWAARHLCR